LTAFGRDSYDPAWSPTGEWIAFVSSNPGNDEIYRITPDGSVVERLTNNNWEWDKHPTWSPDGSQIVFFSNRDVGRPQLWIMNANGSGQRNLLSSDDEDLYPVWTR
jgi:TolB protein